jgi:predicted unusual protein kinase regulating ubiquinone biosynthesis (AarF/ABC1/UbiB family)
MNPISSVRRFIRIVRISGRHAAAHALHRLLKRWPALAEKVLGHDLPGPMRLRLAIEEIGGTLIKFGQMLAMQSDLLPLEYCRVLFTLFDQVPPFSYEEVERIFMEDLKQSPLKIFSFFDQIPIATGSIGQVHVAMLGVRKVAVKVRRPTITRDFAADIVSLKILAGAVKLLRLKWLYWVIAPIEEFLAWTEEELDFRREAHYIDELGRNAKENKYEKVPIVFWSCTTARILTAEFLDGITISEYLRNRESGSPRLRPGFNAELFASRLIDNFLGDAFRHGMFHADLHPGNLMILAGNVVGYVDFGISGVLSRYSRRHLIAMTLAYARGNLDAMCESFFRISTFAKNADPAGFRQGIINASSAWYGSGDKESRLRKSITSIMLDLLIISKNNGVWPQRDVIKYIRSAIALDGLIKTFAPGVDIGRHLEEACERHIKWDSVATLTSSSMTVASFGGVTRLVRDGFLRILTILGRLGQEKSKAPLSPARGSNKRWIHEAMQFLWIVLCLALPLLSGTRDRAIWLFHPLSGLFSLTMAMIIWRSLKSIRSHGS